MIKRILGRTRLEVTQLGFGAMELRGPKTWSGREVSEDQAAILLHAVLDSGINFIDTSPDYGLSEERIGRHIASRRGEYFIATKCGCNPRDMGDHIETMPHDWTSANLLRNIEGSLRRMATDHVDVLQLHNATVDEVAAHGVVDTLLKIKSRGLTRFLGVSTTYPHLEAFLDMGVFDTFQIPYSCLEPLHHDAIAQVGNAGAGVIVRGGIAQGAPGGQWEATRRAELWQRARLDELARGMSAQEMILRFTLSHPHCHTCIVGTGSVEHLQQNLAAAAKGPLSPDAYEEILFRVEEAMTTA